MKPSKLVRLVLCGFIAIFVFAAAYLMLDELGIWPRLPARLTRGVEVLTGLILLMALLSHLVLAAGAIPAVGRDAEPGP